jgi:hypothetical protein
MTWEERYKQDTVREGKIREQREGRRAKKEGPTVE